MPGAELSPAEPVVTGVSRLAVPAGDLQVVLHAVLGGHPGPGEGVGLEVAPLLQHEGPGRGEPDLAGLGRRQETDPVVLVVEVLSAPAVVVEGLNDGDRVEVVLETSGGGLDMVRSVRERGERLAWIVLVPSQLI